MENMATRQLGPSLTVPAIGVGCMGMSGTYGHADEVEAIATIERAMDLGAALLDTSDMYGAGHNEELVGRAVAGRRQQAVIVTKFGQVLDEGGRPAGVDGSPAYVHKAFEASTRRLGLDFVDLYLQHRVDPSVPIEETIGAMATLVDQGKVGAIGVCEASAATIRRAHAEHPLACVQSEYSLWYRGVEADILPTCDELGIGLMAYSPLGRGILTGAVRSEDELGSDDRRRAHPRFQGENLRRNVELVDGLQRLAHDLGCEPAQLALAWLLARHPAVVPIPGVKSRQHLDADLAALDVVLDQDHLRQIEELLPVGAGAGLRYPEANMSGLEL